MMIGMGTKLNIEQAEFFLTDVFTNLNVTNVASAYILERVASDPGSSFK